MSICVVNSCFPCIPLRSACYVLAVTSIFHLTPSVGQLALERRQCYPQSVLSVVQFVAGTALVVAFCAGLYFAYGIATESTVPVVTYCAMMLAALLTEWSLGAYLSRCGRPGLADQRCPTPVALLVFAALHSAVELYWLICVNSYRVKLTNRQSTNPPKEEET